MLRKPLLTFVALILLLFPGQTRAEMYMTLDEPFSGFSSNDVGDIVYMDLSGGARIIWVGTARGISKTSDGGLTWSFYDLRNGLNQNIISALAASGTDLWAATSYDKLVQGELYPYGRGFNTTEDFGDTWDSFIPFQVSKYAGMVCYDIAIDGTTVWASAWYGGLIRSQDGGENWENVFVDSAAQVDFEDEIFRDLRNYFFAVVVDTACPIEKTLRNSINDISYDGKLLWVATQNGLQASPTLGNSWFEFDTSGGLNSNGVYCLGGDTSGVWVGLYEQEETHPLPLIPSLTGADLNSTTDNGNTWSVSSPDLGQASSFEKFAFDIAVADTAVWAACGKGGLIRSFDRGQTWENVFVDTAAERRFEEEVLEECDIFTSMAADTFAVDSTVIWAGTRDGMFKFVFTVDDSADTVFHYLSSGPMQTNEILSIGVQTYHDQKVVWASANEVTSPPPHTPPGVTYKTTDGGETWNSHLEGIVVRDFDFLDSAVWAASHDGLKRSTDGGGNWDTFEIVDSVSGELIIPSQFTSVCVVPYVTDTFVFVGSVDGLARSRDDGITWEVTKFAQSFKKAVWAGTAAGILKFIFNYRELPDTALHYWYPSDNITGNWIVALAIQEHNGKKVVWAATQLAYTGRYGASFSTDDGDSWDTTLVDDEVWNFAFDDTVVWAATSAGLKRSEDWGENWEIFNYMEDQDPISQATIWSTEYTSVTIIDGEVWAGNIDGLVKGTYDGQAWGWDVIRTAVPETYAYPSPFSPILQERVRIHYRPQQDGPVTVKIYDFAMNLVATLADGKDVIGGEWYDEFWDGKNEKGDVVANGVYFFKVQAAGDQTEWGKLVILK